MIQNEQNSANKQYIRSNEQDQQNITLPMKFKKKVNVTTPMKYKLIKAASMERKVNQKAKMKFKINKAAPMELKINNNNKKQER